MDMFISLLQSFLPFVITAAIGLEKRLVDKVPKFLRPVLAAGLGAASTYVSGKSLGSGAVAGLAAVGVHQLLDQGAKFLNSDA